MDDFVELLVMRHAKSSWATYASDFDRPLNDRGSAAAALMADWLVDQALRPDLIIASSALRARTTIEPVVEAFGLRDRDVTLMRTLYHAGVDEWLDVLRSQTERRVLICGHNPGLDDLVIELLGYMPPLTASGKLMTTAAVAHLSVGAWRALAPSGATLLNLERPRSR